MKKIGIKKHDMKKNGAVLLAVTMTGIFFSLFVNISYASYAGRLASIQARFPYDAVTRKTVTRDVRSLIVAHKNVKETYISPWMESAVPTEKEAKKNSRLKNILPIFPPVFYTIEMPRRTIMM